jgi:hypothetical protein
MQVTSKKIACTACGSLILPATVAEHGGLCTPCNRGTRKQIEDGKLYHAARKKAEATADPARDHWRWLLRQVHETPQGFVGLSAENQNYFAIWLLEGEIYNGGFDQYFCNGSADYYTHAVRGLTEIGASECCRIVIAAKHLLFGLRDVPDRASRLSQLRRNSQAQNAELENLDRFFCKEAAGLHDLATQYAWKHGLYKA